MRCAHSAGRSGAKAGLDAENAVEADDASLPKDLIARNLEKRARAQKQKAADSNDAETGTTGRADVIAEGDEDRWLDTVVGGLSEAASRDRGDRTDEENAKLDKVLDELNALAKRDKNDRDSDEIIGEVRFPVRDSGNLERGRGAEGGHPATEG